MGEIFLDAEKVDFEGAAPATVAEAWTVVSEYLGGMGRVLEEMQVDGQAWDAEKGDPNVGYGCIRFVSLSQGEKVFQLAQRWLSAGRALLPELEAKSVCVLSLSWESACQEASASLEALRPVLEGFGLMCQYGEQVQATWLSVALEGYGACVKSIETVLAAVDAGNVVQLSDGFALDLLVAWEAFLERVEGELMPFLAQEGRSHA